MWKEYIDFSRALQNVLFFPTFHFIYLFIFPKFRFFPFEFFWIPFFSILIVKLKKKKNYFFFPSNTVLCIYIFLVNKFW